jgi:hypothetical protein
VEREIGALGMNVERYVPIMAWQWSHLASVIPLAGAVHHLGEGLRSAFIRAYRCRRHCRHLARRLALGSAISADILVRNTGDHHAAPELPAVSPSPRVRRLSPSSRRLFETAHQGEKDEPVQHHGEGPVLRDLQSHSYVPPLLVDPESDTAGVLPHRGWDMVLRSTLPLL